MSERRKITDEREARRCLAAARKAGERAGAWARAHGIDGRSLNAWRINLARRGAGAMPVRAATRPAKPTAMVVQPQPRVALVELVPSPRPSARAPARYLIHVGEVRVEVGDDFAAETLRRIVEVLRAC